jgi:hypothetical protein
MAIAVMPLQSNKFDDGLVLARLGHARVGEALWREELAAVSRGPLKGGALLARTSDGRACGLILFRIEAVVDDPPSVQVVRLVAFDLMNPEAIANALVEEAFRLARLQGCQTLRLVQPLSQSPDARVLLLNSGMAELHSLF